MSANNFIDKSVKMTLSQGHVAQHSAHLTGGMRVAISLQSGFLQMTGPL